MLVGGVPSFLASLGMKQNERENLSFWEEEAMQLEDIFIIYVAENYHKNSNTWFMPTEKKYLPRD